MLLTALAWFYVVSMVAIVEATSDQGTVLGAIFTFTLYGLMPMGIVGYLFLSPARRRAQALTELETAELTNDESAVVDPDQSAHAPSAPITPEREKP
jgi:hypothetical protein